LIGRLDLNSTETETHWQIIRRSRVTAFRRCSCLLSAANSAAPRNPNIQKSRISGAPPLGPRADAREILEGVLGSSPSFADKADAEKPLQDRKRGRPIGGSPAVREQLGQLSEFLTLFCPLLGQAQRVKAGNLLIVLEFPMPVHLRRLEPQCRRILQLPVY
jgi:hypothetical protein